MTKTNKSKAEAYELIEQLKSKITEVADGEIINISCNYKKFENTLIEKFFPYNSGEIGEYEQSHRHDVVMETLNKNKSYLYMFADDKQAKEISPQKEIEITLKAFEILLDLYSETKDLTFNYIENLVDFLLVYFQRFDVSGNIIPYWATEETKEKLRLSVTAAPENFAWPWPEAAKMYVHSVYSYNTYSPQSMKDTFGNYITYDLRPCDIKKILEDCSDLQSYFGADFVRLMLEHLEVGEFEKFRYFLLKIAEERCNFLHNVLFPCHSFIRHKIKQA